MYVMAKNSRGSFGKIASITVNNNGTVYDLRQTLTSALTGSLKGKKFILLTETLQEVEESQEKKLVVCQVYNSDRVLIKWTKEEAATSKMCPCGNQGQFFCSSCRRQMYCSPKCQTRDWPRHANVCSKFK